VWNLFKRETDTGGHPKTDAGSGSLDDYKYDLIPKNGHVTMQLAGSDPHQDEIRRVQGLGAEKLEVFIPKRTVEEERTDAPMAVRFFVDKRMSAPVGWIPRGLESVIAQALARLDDSGRSTRIPAEIVKSKHGLRVKLLMGRTR